MIVLHPNLNQTKQKPAFIVITAVDNAVRVITLAAIESRTLSSLPCPLLLTAARRHRRTLFHRQLHIVVVAPLMIP
jgi:hypothetical protein